MKRFLGISIISASLLLTASNPQSFSDDCCPNANTLRVPCQTVYKADFACSSDSISLSCNSCDELDQSINSTSIVRTTLHLRSQGANTARELVGWQWDIYGLRNATCLPSIGYLAYEYTHSFRGDRMALALFGTTQLTFSGSLVANRQPSDLLADNFGLSTTCTGSVSFNPSITNHIVDLGYFIDLPWCEGMYARFHAPIVHTTWNLGAGCATKCAPGLTQTNTGMAFEPCYMGPQTTPSAPSLMDALSGTFLFGDMQTPWPSGRFPFKAVSKTGLADIDVILGYNFFNHDIHHVGFYFQGVLPTGGTIKDRSIFSPVVGNGGSFELGLGVSAHVTLWQGCHSDLAIFAEGNFTHMFKRSECRLFDFDSAGAFSRYMLLKEFETNGGTRAYNGTLISATTYMRRPVHVKVNFKGDGSVKFAYRHKGFGIDVGYNIYGHLAESVELACNPCDTERQFGFKGVEGTCYFQYPIAEIDIDGTEVPTIFPNGTDFPAGATPPAGCPPLGTTSVTLQLVNNNTQPAATAFSAAPITGTAPTCTVALVNGNSLVTKPIPVADLTPANGFSVTIPTLPTIVSPEDIRIRSGEAPSVLTNKFFWHVMYQWCEPSEHNPQIGIGGEIEFEGSLENDPNLFKHGGLNQWGVWVKGVCSF